MIPSVKERQKGAYDFKTFYESVCALNNVVPLQSVTCHLPEGILDIIVDRIRLPDWDPIIKSLRINRNLNFVAFRSFLKTNIEKGSNASYRRPVPTLLASATVRRNLCRAIRSTLRLSKHIAFLELQNISIGNVEVTTLCEGIMQNRTLKHLSFEGSPVGDEGLQELCRAIRNAPELAALNLTGCGITAQGIEYLTQLIKFQAIQRHGAAWEDSLRYRHPNMDQFGGLRRITLSDNPQIGDAGSINMAEALADDLWIKAIDLQACGLTDASARVWLSVLAGTQVKVKSSDSRANTGNRSLFVLDLRRNPAIARDLLRAVTERALMNAEGKQTEYNWLRANPHAPTQLCSGVVVYPWPGITGFHTDHLQNRSSSRASGSFQSKLSLVRRPRPQSATTLTTRPNSGSHPEKRKYEARDGRLTGRPVFIPAGGKPRSRSLTSMKHVTGTDCQNSTPQHLQTRSSNKRSRCKLELASHKDPWKPAGKTGPSTAHSVTCATRQPRLLSGGGIPWHTAARASKCCRWYPGNQLPGQSCLEASTMHRKQSFTNVTTTPRRPSSSNSSWRIGRTGLYSPHKHTGKIGWQGQTEALKRPITTTTKSDQSKTVRLQNQVKRLMARVAQLELELSRAKKNPYPAGCNKESDDNRVLNPFDVAQPNALKRLNDFLTTLQELVGHMNKNGFEVGDRESQVDQLKTNVQKLCELVDQTARRANVEKSSYSPKKQDPGHEGKARVGSHYSIQVVTAKGEQNVGDGDGKLVLHDSSAEHHYCGDGASDTSRTMHKIDKVTQCNNHNLDPLGDVNNTRTESPILGEVTRCAYPSEFPVVNSPVKSIESDRLDHANGGSSTETVQQGTPITDSLMHLERLASEANEMYAELTQIKKASFIGEEKTKCCNAEKSHIQNSDTSTTSANRPKFVRGKANAMFAGTASKCSMCPGKSLTLSRIRLLDKKSDDEELISDDEDNLKLWSVSSQDSNRSTPARLERAQQRLGKSESCREYKTDSSGLDDSEFTIRENLHLHSDEDLEDLLIDYSLDASADNNSDDDDDGDGDLGSDDRDDKHFIDFSDLALSDSHASMHTRSNALVYTN